jgi:hypothetical protein
MEFPAYWLGVGLLTLGLALVIAGTRGWVGGALARLGSTLTWLGFLGTAVSYAFVDDRFGATLRESWRTHQGIWIVWICAVVLLVSSWTGIVSRRVGWIALVIGLSLTVASWTQDPATQFVTVSVGLSVVVFLLRRRNDEPGDLAEQPTTAAIPRRLLNACHGDRDLVERLIQYELRRSPHLSRSAAGQAALERLWADRR